MRVRIVPVILCAGFIMAVLPGAYAAEAQNPKAHPMGSYGETLYFHIFDPFNKFPINTQPYNASFFDVGGTNFPTCNPCSGAGGQSTNVNLDQNTVYGYSTAGPVEYNFLEGGRPRIHPERGIAHDILIDTTKETDTKAYLYIDPRGLFGGSESPGIIPKITFQVTMRTGNAAGSDFNAGDLIMQGHETVDLVDTTTNPQDWEGVLFLRPYPTEICTGGVCTYNATTVNQGNQYVGNQSKDGEGHRILAPNADGVVEIIAPMKIAMDKIPKADAYNIRIDWFQGDDASGPAGQPQDAFAQGNLRLVLDKNYLPRLEMFVKNPVYIDYIHPEVAGGLLLIHTAMNSPFGTYDLDYSQMKMTMDGPTTPKTLRQVASLGQHVHNLHDKSAEVTWLWDFRSENAAEGTYHIHLSVPNLQHSKDGSKIAMAEDDATFIITPQEAYGVSNTGEKVEPTKQETTQKSPLGSGPLVALLLLGCALISMRRKEA